ncbi:MAG: DUF58 domain-containing protein [Polyangiaceae bacterium]|nr:DUF58 domain-containing protein [Polyangiaceae bacterium]
MKIVPTRRLVALLFASTAIAIATGIARSSDAPWLVLDAAILALAGIDVAASRPRGAAVFEVERHAAQIFSVGRSNAVALTLHNTTRRRLAGTVMDDPAGDANVSGLPGVFDLPPRTSTTIKYEITPTRRGRRELRAITVRYGSPLGLVTRQEVHERPETIDVYPDVHAARTLELLRRQGRQDARMGSLRVHGGDTEFERLRPYQVGDEIRRIDWHATARRDEFVVRQFQAESNQNVVFAIDVGRSMRGESHGITSIDHALGAALLTADVALRGGDRSGLLTFDDKPRSFLPPSGGALGGRKLTRATFALDAGLAATDYRAAMVFLKTHVKARSLFVIFTNLLEPRSARDLASAVKSLMPRHLPLCVMMRDEEIEDLAIAPIRSRGDALVRAAAAESLTWRDSIVRSLRSAGALVLDARPREVTPALVNRYLEIKARRLL